MRRKSQAAAEFLIIFMMLMIALSIAVYMSVYRTQELSGSKIGIETNKILNDVSNKVNMAFLGGPGFMVNLTLPDNIFGREYSIYIQSNYVSLEVSNTTHFKSLVTGNITGSLIKGVNLVRNRDGMIVIS